MEAKILTFQGENDPKLYSCGKCGSVFSPKAYACRDDMAHEAARKRADECCAKKFCACGTELEGSWTACAPCRQRNMLLKAEIVDAQSYDGAVSADVTGDWGEGYSSDIDAMLQSCEDYDEPVPIYCHPCTEQHLRLDAYSLLEQATEDMHEDAHDQVVDADALVAFLKDWNAKQTCISYYEDRSRVIVLDQERFDALIAEREPA